jgi:hypothetical protein
MLSFLARGHPPQRRHTASEQKVFYEDGRSSQTFHSAPSSTSPFLTHTFYPDTALFHPPPHFHSFQTETLTVRRGTGHFFMSTNSTAPDESKPIVKRNGDSPVEIPINAYHFLRNGGAEGEEMEMDIQLDPIVKDAEMRFFRNLFGCVILSACGNCPVSPRRGVRSSEKLTSAKIATSMTAARTTFSRASSRSSA